MKRNGLLKLAERAGTRLPPGRLQATARGGRISAAAEMQVGIRQTISKTKEEEERKGVRLCAT
jgi:hypothetical protein